jgi:hypothetical protein
LGTEKSPPQKRKYSPVTFYAADFFGLQPFFGQSTPIYKPYTQRKTKPSYPSQPFALKTLAGLASKSVRFRGTLATSLG